MLMKLKIDTTCKVCGEKIEAKTEMVQELRDIESRPYLYQAHIECEGRKDASSNKGLK